MTEFIKSYRQHLPALRFIGKKYGDGDNIGQCWGDWHCNGWFDIVERAGVADCEDSDAYLGLMRRKAGEPVTYWIGMFCKADAEVPEGFESIDLPTSDLGVVWVCGQEHEVYGKEDVCAQICREAGMQVLTDEQGACWSVERYGCPRFTTPDEQGRVILDICHFIV